MSDEQEQTLMPVFPLATVLVPGELLPLHIFEDRYKAMVNDALQGERRFGLSYVDSAEVGKDTPPEAGSIGCIAQISAIIPLPDGRMNILVIGAGRYAIREYTQQEPYLVALVDLLTDEEVEETSLDVLADEARELFGRLATAARALSSENSDQEPPSLDVSPEPLSFLIAANIALDNDVKQEMLELTNTEDRLNALVARLRELVGTYEYRAEMHSRSKSNGHGRKAPEE